MTSIRPLLQHKLFDPLRVKPEDDAPVGSADGADAAAAPPPEIIELTMEGTESDEDVRRRAKRPSDGFVSSLSSRVAALDIDDDGDSPAAAAGEERAHRTPRRQSARKAAARKDAAESDSQDAETSAAAAAEPGTSATTPLRSRPKRRSSVKAPAAK